MHWIPTRAAALAQLEEFIPSAGRKYERTRNYDDGTSRSNVSQLSPWLHAGIIKETEVLQAALAQHSLKTADKFISEIFWRIYFKGYLEQRPTIWYSYTQGRDAAVDAIANNSGLRTAYERAIQGKTSIPAFDHWAQELAETGYLHNHARMWFASIWIFTLRLDWHLGADFFLRHLIDGDAASNTLSWRWVGGLHSKGKTYTARAGNITRYTANHPDGPLSVNGLASETDALTEDTQHGRQPLDLPAPDGRAGPGKDVQKPYALLLHDEGAHHQPLSLDQSPALIIVAARPEFRSNAGIGALAGDFARGAVAAGVEEASAHFQCDAQIWNKDDSLAAILEGANITHLAAPYLPTGWTRDALWPELAACAAEGRLKQCLPDLDRATWPFAKAGFFGVRKAIDSVLGELAIPVH
ncbi:FAD-binding domain-containing protein [Pontixanthobacter sp.]|uniref:FAD-binding domain-containing protein n=1 Tax=Pontixanthobacter sp. TaxID=2792078 RepID=UPI003C7D9B10